MELRGTKGQPYCRRIVVAAIPPHDPIARAGISAGTEDAPIAACDGFVREEDRGDRGPLVTGTCAGLFAP